MAKFRDAALTPWGAGDCKWVISGELAVFGLPYSVCPGCTFQQKLTFMTNLRPADLGRLLKEELSAFLATVKAGELLAIPPATMVLMHAEGNVEGIRWGFLPYNAKEVAQAMRNSVLGLIDYQEKANADGTWDLKEWVRYMEKDLRIDG